MTSRASPIASSSSHNRTRGKSSLAEAQAIAAQQMNGINNYMGINGSNGMLAGGVTRLKITNTLPTAATLSATHARMATPMTASSVRPSTATAGRSSLPSSSSSSNGSRAVTNVLSRTAHYDDQFADANSSTHSSAHTSSTTLTHHPIVPHHDEHHHADTVPASAPVAAAVPLEGEYIVNLQQQVYYLELELNLMKKAVGGGGSINPTGLKSGSAGSGNELVDVGDAPLDDVIVSLRSKYVQMESDYHVELDAVRGENSDLRSRVRMRELELANLKNLHSDLAGQSDEWKSTAHEHQSTLLDHQLANESMILKLTSRLAKRELKLEKTADEFLELKAAFGVASENYSLERASYTAKWEQREARMDALNDACQSEKAINLEWSERFRTSDVARLLAQVQSLQSTAVALEADLRKSESARDQAERNRLSAAESLNGILEQNAELHRSVAALEQALERREDKEQRDRLAKSFWSAEVAAMQASVSNLSDKLGRVQGKYSDAKGLKNQLKDELVKSRIYQSELAQRLQDEVASHAATRQTEDNSNESNRELKRDLTLKTEELTTLMARYRELKAASSLAHAERDELQVKHAELSSQAEVNDALSKLKLHEFVSMAHSNLKVAGAIEGLMSKMGAAKPGAAAAGAGAAAGSGQSLSLTISGGGSNVAHASSSPYADDESSENRRERGARDREREREKDRERDRERERERDHREREHEREREARHTRERRRREDEHDDLYASNNSSFTTSPPPVSHPHPRGVSSSSSSSYASSYQIDSRPSTGLTDSSDFTDSRPTTATEVITDDESSFE